MYDQILWRGVEPEVGAMLFAIVRLLKPEVCVETGLYVGDSAHWIGRALLENKKGKLTTCDIDSERIAPARARFANDGLPITVNEQSGFELLHSFQQMDFVHIDSGNQEVRREELMSIGEHNISPGGVVCYHDATRDMTCLYEPFAEKHDWPHIIFPSYVGLAVFMRPE